LAQPFQAWLARTAAERVQASEVAGGARTFLVVASEAHQREQAKFEAYSFVVIASATVSSRDRAAPANPISVCFSLAEGVGQCLTT
jgi:hypothetical protein